MTASTIDNTVPFGSMLKDKSGPPKKRQNSGKREGQEFIDQVHRKQIATLRCCIPSCSQHAPSHAHHLRIPAERGMGQRATDKWCVPLCAADHEACHKVGTRKEGKWFEDQGIDPYELARALWGARGNPAAMARIVQAHRQGDQE